MGEFDETERVAEGADLVGQIVGVDGDAVPADAGARGERVKAERFGFGGVDRFPQVDAEVVTKDRHFVDEGDVDVAVRVFEQFGHFGFAGAADGHDRVDEPVGERAGSGGGGVVVAADDFGGVVDPEVFVAGVDPFGRVGEEEVVAGPQPGGFEEGTDDVVDVGPALGEVVDKAAVSDRSGGQSARFGA